MSENRKTKAKGKLVRTYGINIFEQPKYDKLLKKKPHAPGMHGAKKKRTKGTEYGKQLVEKQKLKFCYGLSEKQFRNIFEKAKPLPGITGDNMLQLLERRLDNVVFRMGICTTRAMARQFVGHGHVTVNGRPVNIPSVTLRPGDVVQVKDREASKKLARESLAKAVRAKAAWIDMVEDSLSATINHVPRREEIPTVANEQMVVELYAK